MKDIIAKNLLEGKNCDNCSFKDFTDSAICTNPNRRAELPKECTCAHWHKMWDIVMSPYIPINPKPDYLKNYNKISIEVKFEK